ncbi:MAG TPA: LL-diaminopimelate aminotransferase [Spirochaetota bacterium]|nr:LL-diaminopimelate aminotransferase [Spirochaetota bacterium]HOM38801.1 LL-diaminopimelate aminotransferase [Spirochaetota bacterium]HPQ49859.1 LL-diaminopimelate aminotransferase [Spirochaetota bacterium]
MDSYIQNLFAERIGGKNFGKENVIYKFEKIKRAKREALKNNPGVEILDFGVGEPDDMANSLIRERVKKEVDLWENRGYADNGIEEFKEAAARYMKKVFNVEVDPAKHIIHGIGSKPVLAMFPSIFINPGDITIMTVPGYPVLGTHTKWLGGEVYNIKLKEENNYLPELDKIPPDILKRAKILVLNYPNNPTGAYADETFYKDVVAFAKENNIIVVQDAAYSTLVYGEKPLSFLSIPGAMDVGVEIHSLSKSYNMTGWRLAFVVGNELIIKGYATVKDNIDSGQFKAIQKAGITALEHPEITEEIRKKYERRLSKMVQILNKKGFNAKMPGGTFYLYVKAPKKVNGIDVPSAEMFSEYLIKEKLISTVPWDDAGSYIRFSATFIAKDEKDEERVLKELEKRLEDLKLEF